MRLDLWKVTLESLPRQEHSYRPIALFLGLHLQRGRQAPHIQTRWHVCGGVWEVGANLLHPLSQASECGGPLALTLVQAASGFRSLPRPASGAPVTKAIDRVG